MRRGEASVGEGRVDDVVVNQGAGLIELERRPETCGGDARHEPVPLRSPRARRAQRQPDGAEDRPHPLARGHQGLGGVEQVVGGRGRVGPPGPVDAQHVGEPGADHGAHCP